MFNILSDAEINALITEKKPLPNGLRPYTTAMSKAIERNHSWRREFETTGETGNVFVIFFRLSTLNVMDFSAILGYKVPGYNTIFRLRRYNGKHTHTNSIEKQTFRDFHIHTATERYQNIHAKEETFAEVVKRYSNLEGAIDCMIQDCGFQVPMAPLPLFDQGEP